MEIVETAKTTHKLLVIHYKTFNDQVYEKSIDINRTEDGEILSVSIGSKEISAFDLQILDFLKEKGKL